MASKRRVFGAKSKSGHRIHDDHKRPVTRRDFLASGLLSFSGYMMAPSLLQLLTADNAFAAGAAQCLAGSTGARMPAFVSVNLVGGPALPGNYIPLDQGRQMYSNYSVLGLGSNPPVANEFQGVGFAGAVGGRLTSQLLQGLRDATSAVTRQKTSFIAVCHVSQDDTSLNKIDCSGLISAAGLQGTLLPKLGQRDTVTGVNQDFAIMQPPAPLVVSTIGDIKNALLPAGALARKLSRTEQTSVLQLIAKLTGRQAAAIRLPSSASGTTLANLAECATGKNVELSTSTNLGVDPMLDTLNGVAATWDMANAVDLFGQSQVNRQAMGAMVYNALKGQAGTVGIDLGGYDYHGSPRQGAGSTDEKDLHAGWVIGKILESANLMGQKVFIQVQADGSVSTSGTSITDGYTADHGNVGGGMGYILAFDPNGRPQIKNDIYRHQLGYYTSQMVASSTDKINNPEAAGLATFANYMKFAGAMDTFERMLPRQFSAAELDYILRFA